MKKLQALLLLLSAFAVTNVYAAVPVGIDTAITTAQTDAATVSGYVIIALAGLVALRWMTRLVKGA